MADTQRAIGIGGQAVATVAAATIHPLNQITDFGHKPNLGFDVPKFKVNHRWMERKARPTVRYDEVNVAGRVDATEIGWFLLSGMGAPVTPNFTFKGGSSANPRLTVKFSEGLTQYWVMQNSQVNTLELNLDGPAGTFAFTSTLRGINGLPTASLWVPVYAPADDDTPFAPWQTVVTKGGVPFRLVSFRMTLNNNVEPFYETPDTDPIAGQEQGLFASDFDEGETVGTYEIVARYAGDAGSLFEDYRKSLGSEWVVTATDPNTDLSGGGNPQIIITAPDGQATDSDLDRSRPKVLQTARGSLLYKPGEGGLNIQLVNALTGYTLT